MRELLVALLVAGAAPEPGFVRDGLPTAQARAIAAALAAAADEGLDPAEYGGGAWPERLRALGAGRAAPGDAERLDADLREAAIRYARALRRGRVSPVALGHDDLPYERFDAAAFVASLAADPHPAARLEALAPPFEAYDRLAHALPRLRATAELRRGAPPLAPPPRPVRPGDAYADAGRLAELLADLGDLEEPERAAAAPGVLGPELARAVARFQARHALAADGVVGPRTVEALNVPLDARVRQVELALERWRWMPRALGARWIAVNVPAQRLEAGEGDSPRTAVAMDVIVGASEEDRRTPVLVAHATGVVFAPYWDVPRALAVDELAGQLARRPGMAEGDGYFVETASARLPAVRDTLALVRSGEARLRQRPGPRNQLGPMKLVMPNAHDVYLHGTAAPRLFRRTDRALSHGCIRVADPAALAELLLGGEGGWDRERIEAAMARAEPLAAPLPAPATVLLVYATATADEDGTLRFWPDLYGEDGRLDEALRRARAPADAPPRDAGDPEVDRAPDEAEAVAGDAGERGGEERAVEGEDVEARASIRLRR